ncbi:MAG: NAD(P)H-dependent oxidoreductase subunit E [Candidatus Cloacimonas sp.]|jgi:NADH-quinone oxidoreductase subunit E/NADP-reducing hydrogenase subunit HndA|nr:NAD(P)H-dependent oxidoreductase subunit E [Candidatus Cloacimonadota bacterium]
MQKDSVLYQELREVINEKKSLRNPLIEILHKAQDIFGYLPPEVQEFVAEELNMPVNKVYGVVTFYNAFTMKPRGKYVINVCTGTACYVKGAPRIIQMLTEILGVELGETTEDKKFTLTAVRCVGACSLAPVFVIGDDTYGRIETRAQLQGILDKYLKDEV